MTNTRHTHSSRHRRSIRLPDYDYAKEGLYYVTICLHEKACLFGQIANDQMVLNEAGRMVEKWYWELETKFQGIRCRDMVVMPNHVHAIVQNTGEIEGTNLSGGAAGPEKGGHVGPPLHRIIAWWKTMTTNEYIRGVKQNRFLPFAGRLWQRNYYERIIRDETELNNIREYIKYNPQNWRSDDEFIPLSHTD